MSAFYMECKPMDMYISGSLLTKTRFRGTSVKVGPPSARARGAGGGCRPIAVEPDANARLASPGRPCAGTPQVDNVGHVEVYIHQYRETYTVTYPEMHLRGLIGGKIFVEITGESHITSSSGFSAKIDHIPYARAPRRRA